MAYRVVCISSTLGAGGETVGRTVAERLGFLYLDDAIVVRAAEKEGLDPKVVRHAEARRSLVGRLLERLAEAGSVEAYAAAGFVPSSATPQEKAFSSELHRTLIREAIEDTADRGNAVIASHAASLALAGRDDVLRVLVTASPDVRAQRIAEAGGAFDDDPAKVIRADDAARADYLRRFYGVDREEPTLYDVVANTDALGVEGAARLLLDLTRS